MIYTIDIGLTLKFVVVGLLMILKNNKLEWKNLKLIFSCRTVGGGFEENVDTSLGRVWVQ